MNRFVEESNRLARNAAVKEKLRVAFRRLRREGFIARQSFQCCMGCALSELDSVLALSPEKRGAVYFHRQDAEAFGRRGDHVGLHVRFTGRADDEAGMLAAAAAAVAAFADAGFSPEWSGDPDQTIWLPFAAGLAPMRSSDAKEGGVAK